MGNTEFWQRTLVVGLLTGATRVLGRWLILASLGLAPLAVLAESEEPGPAGERVQEEEAELDEPDELEQVSAKEEEAAETDEPPAAKPKDRAARKEERRKARIQRKYAEEREFGAEAHRTILAQFGVYRDRELQAYVEKVGKRVAAESSRPDMEFTFTVLDDDMINAMAVPGGYIYVTRGILAHMKSESELAAVLGHEIGHITERHTFRKQNRQKVMEALTMVTTIVTGVYAMPEIGNLFGGVLLQGYSREFELEADRVGAEFMAKAGYRPDAMLDTIETLKATDKFEYERARNEKRDPRVYHGFLSSHPDNDRRYEEGIRAASRLGTRYEESIPEDEFLEKLDGLVFGKSRQVGVVRDDTFYHRKVGIKMKIPDGWFVESDRTGVYFVSPARDAALQLTSRSLRKEQSPEEFVKETLRVRVREGRPLTIANMPAYLAIAERASSPWGLKPARMAILFDHRRRQAYIFAGAGKRDLRAVAADKTFIGAIFSLSKMTREDYQLATTPKVKVIQVEEGMTVESLAAESRLPNYAESQIRVLNGIYPRGELEPGDYVKVVE